MRLVSAGLLVSVLGLAATGPLEAQGGRAPAPHGAEFFLARTGELRLTDAQVVRLAAIARRSAERRRALRASMDTVRRPAAPGLRGDSVARAARMRDVEQVRARFEREREQARADLRDALAVLTADQQAMAWDMVAGGGARVRGARGPRFGDDRGSRRAGRPPARDDRRRDRGPQPGQRPPR